MSLGPDNSRIRSVFGDNCQLKFGASPAWTKLGKTNKTFLKDTPSSSTSKFSNGASLKSYNGEEVTLEVEIAQTSKEEIDTLRALRGTSVPVYFDAGKVGGKLQDFYAPEGMILDAVELESGASDNMKIKLMISITPQAAPVVVTPSTGLPADAKSHSIATSQTSVNNYYLFIETAPS